MGRSSLPLCLATSRDAKLGPMTTREKAQKLLDELPESELEPIVEILASRGTSGADPEAGDSPVTGLDEPEMVGLPEHLQTFEDGTPVPNWVAGLDEVRNGR
jgi:hypothetical protein